MKKTKIIDSKDYRQYKKQLHQFMQKVNPKPSASERENLKKQYLESRKAYGTN